MIYGSHLLCYQINSINHVCDSKRFQQNKQIINQILLSSDASFIYVIIISSAVQLVASMDPSTVQQQQQMTVNQPPRPPITSSRPPVVPYDLMFPFLIPHLHLAAELQFLFAKYKMCVCVSNSNAFPILLTKLFVLSIFMSFVLEMKYPGILCYEVCYTLWGVNCLSQQQQKWQNRQVEWMMVYAVLHIIFL